MEKLIPDVYGKILVTLDVKNLIRCKSVCKSWKFLISDPFFIKAHLNHSCSNNEYGHSRMGEIVSPVCWLNSQNMHSDGPVYYVIGSSNGLVCIRSFISDETLVINPATREEKMLPKPRLLHKDVYNTYWGFGYDSVSDDYKFVLLGVITHGEKTCFQVLSLKSNAWTLIGQLNYTFHTSQRVGIFCNGALHWAVSTPNQDREVILSFDLSQEEFKEIPRPVDSNHKTILVGILEECLCIVTTDFSTNDLGRKNYNIWVMQKYNVNQSWKRVELEYCSVKLQYVERMTELENDDPNGRSTQRNTWFFNNRKFTAVPNIGYVESLVSPHL